MVDRLVVWLQRRSRQRRLPPVWEDESQRMKIAQCGGYFPYWRTFVTAAEPRTPLYSNQPYSLYSTTGTSGILPRCSLNVADKDRFLISSDDHTTCTFYPRTLVNGVFLRTVRGGNGEYHRVVTSHRNGWKA